MKELAFIFIIITVSMQAQNHAPAAGQPGSTAIPANSQLFVAWATGIDVQLGFIDISDPTAQDSGSNYASYGSPEDAIGPATNQVVSLGDAGEAILTFNIPIVDGAGFDFAVFENSFSDTFLELAFVEVSSDGINYFRFPSHSATQTETQIGSFGNSDPTYINNLAGKYRGMFGTPFDISEIADDAMLDKNSITHIKIIDVVGSVDSNYARYDSFGNSINDPFTTPFYSGGFDLDAIGVINQQTLGVKHNNDLTFSVYPNPVLNKLYINSVLAVDLEIYDLNGRIVLTVKQSKNEGIDVSNLQKGFYIISITSEGKTSRIKFIKQ